MQNDLIGQEWKRNLGQHHQWVAEGSGRISSIDEEEVARRSTRKNLLVGKQGQTAPLHQRVAELIILYHIYYYLYCIINFASCFVYACCSLNFVVHFLLCVVQWVDACCMMMQLTIAFLYHLLVRKGYASINPFVISLLLWCRI